MSAILVDGSFRNRVDSLMRNRGAAYLSLGGAAIISGQTLVNAEIIHSSPEWESLFEEKLVGGSGLGKDIEDLVSGDTFLFQDGSDTFEFSVFQAENIGALNVPGSVPIVPPTPPPAPYVFPDGTLGNNICDSVDDRIVGKTPAVSINIFSTQNHVGAGTYVRNVDCWANINLTCCSPFNSMLGNRIAGTAVTKRHMVTAAHYEMIIGTTVRFVTAANVVVTRTVTGAARHPDYFPYFPDVTLYTLDSDLPDTITPCKLLPANYTSYLNHLVDGRPPALVLDQEEKALIWDWYENGQSVKFSQPNDSTRNGYFEGIFHGDSGNPIFVIINDAPVLLTVLTAPGVGTFLTPQIAKLNQMILTADAQAGVSTGYTISTADLTGFPTI